MPTPIDFDAAPPTHSTWGPPQGGWRVIAPGIYSCSTASHGGYWLSPARLEAMPKDIRARSWNGMSPWFEEDCDVLLVVRAFPDLFSDEMREYAEKDRLSRILMATREAARQARFVAWKLSGRDVASLVAAGQDLAGETGYDAAGRVYDPGFMEIYKNGWLINVGNSSRICATLGEAETYLWHAYVETETRQAKSAAS